MAGIKLFEDQLRLMTPHTYNALTKLVMAMAAVAKNAGKTTFFGRDKGQISYSNFLGALRVTVQSMLLDGLVSESTPNQQVVTALESKLQQFSMAHPNWQDAYGFAAHFLGNDGRDAAATIERIRSLG